MEGNQKRILNRMLRVGIPLIAMVILTSLLMHQLGNPGFIDFLIIVGLVISGVYYGRGITIWGYEDKEN